jgi:hypothetical protein
VSDPVYQRLVTQWRERESVARSLARQHEGDSAGNTHAFLKEARIWKTCADELALASPPPDEPPDQIGGLLQSIQARTSERDQSRAVVEMLEAAHVEQVQEIAALRKALLRAIDLAKVQGLDDEDIAELNNIERSVPPDDPEAHPREDDKHGRV